MAYNSGLNLIGILLSGVETAINAKVRVRVEQDLVPTYTVVSSTGASCGHQHKQRNAAERCAAAKNRKGGNWSVQATTVGPRLRWGLSSRQ